MKLSEDLKFWRAERPDEWTMDRFIKAAEKMEAICDEHFSNQIMQEHAGTRIDFDVYQKELLTFAGHLVDVAIYCLRKSKRDTDTAEGMLCNAMDEISKANAESEVSE